MPRQTHSELTMDHRDSPNPSSRLLNMRVCASFDVRDGSRRPVWTRRTARWTEASSRSVRSIIHGANFTICLAGSVFCATSLRTTASLTLNAAAACCIVSQVLVDDSDALESERMSALAQIVLTSLSFQTCAHLLHRGLADVHIGFTLRVNRLYLLAHRSPSLLFCSRLRAASG